MNKNGPVIVIEDDLDDQEFLKIVFDKLNYINEIKYFSDGQEALNYLNQTAVVPFLILSDINMPKLDGFELRRKLKTDADYNSNVYPTYSFLLL